VGLDISRLSLVSSRGRRLVGLENNFMGVSALDFKEGVRCYGIESYREVTLVYLSKIGFPAEYLFYFFLNDEMHSDTAQNLEILKEKARKEIDVALDGNAA